MPIGNLSSQLFANIVLNELDQYAKHKMRLRHYIAGKLARGEMSKPAAMRRIDSMRGMMDHAESAGLRWRLNETLLDRAGDEIGGDLPFGRGSSDRKTVRNRVRTE